MNALKSLSVLFVVLFVVKVFAVDSWKFDPQTSTVHLEETHLWFTTGDSTQVGPELYSNDVDAPQFNYIKDFLTEKASGTVKVKLDFITITSQTHGEYNCIVFFGQ